MRKSKAHLDWVDFGIFPGNIMFSCGYTKNEIEVALLEQKAKEWLGAFKQLDTLYSRSYAFAANVTDHHRGKNVEFYVLHLRDCFKFTDHDYTVLAHEVLHLCQFYLPSVLDRDVEIETEAYLHTYIMKSILNILRK